MKHSVRHLLALAAVLCALFICTGTAQADESAQAQKLTGKSFFHESYGFPGVECLYDGVGDWGLVTAETAKLTFQADEGIASLYIRFGRSYGSFQITDEDTGEAKQWDTKYLHEYIDLKALFGRVPTTVSIFFQNGSATLYEIEGYTEGTLPEDVQVWEDPKDGETDLVLFSTHCDDEQLFFAGVLPYYAGQRNYQVQLVYLTSHLKANGYTRMHEALDGLWTAGVRNYPIWGEYYDYPVYNLGDAYRYFNAYGWPEAEMLDFVVEQLRRFKPTVVLGHDLNGEYGHGQHMVWADLVAKAVEISGDASQYPDSAETYGAWDVPKTYLHLYQENPIVMDWDQPLDAFGGKTAWQVSMEAYRCHVSQIETLEDADWYFADNLTAASIVTYSPREFGLYRTTVGEVVNKNDFFENTTTYAELNGTATPQPVPTEPESPADTTFPTEPTAVETAPPATEVPETQPENQDPASGEAEYPLWPFLVIGAAVIVAAWALFTGRKDGRDVSAPPKSEETDTSEK